MPTDVMKPYAPTPGYADVPAVDDGSTCFQYFCGYESLFSEVYGMKTEKQFVNTLQDSIRRRGAPTKLISDRAQVEISNRVLDILRHYCIGDWQSEPYQQHQNPTERRWQTVKRLTNTILDRSGAPAFCWLLALQFACFILNHTAAETLGWITPVQSLTGQTPDISPLLRFHFWEPVYYKAGESSFPSESRERAGHFVGIS